MSRCVKVVRDANQASPASLAKPYLKTTVRSRRSSTKNRIPNCKLALVVHCSGGIHQRRTFRGERHNVWRIRKRDCLPLVEQPREEAAAKIDMAVRNDISRSGLTRIRPSFAFNLLQHSAMILSLFMIFKPSLDSLTLTIEPAKAADGVGILVPIPRINMQKQFYVVMRLEHRSERAEAVDWQWVVRYWKFHRHGGE